jgi:hypothetical protein
MRHGSVGHILNPGNYNANYTAVVGSGGGGGGTTPSVAPTAYWPLSDVNDVMPGARNFTNSGTPSFTSGKVGNCANFSFSGGYTSASRASDAGIVLAPTGTSFSVALWINWTSGFVPVIKKSTYPSPTTNGFILEPNNDSVSNYIRCLLMGTPSAQQVTSIQTATFTSGHFGYLTAGFHHLVMVVDRTNDLLKLYFDGVLPWSGASASIAGMTIGDSSGSSLIIGNTADVKVDELGLWGSYALTASEVTFLYNSGNGRTFNGTVWT